MLLRAVLVSALFTALLAFYFRPRFPDSATNHTLKTITGLGVKFINVASYTGGLLGFSPINITRFLVSATILLNPMIEHVKEYDVDLGGVEAVVFEPIQPSSELRAGLIHVHGGGWALMSPAHYAPMLREIVLQTNSVIVSIKYRRAPEVLFPVPVEDCIKGARYFLQNTDKFGVDKNRVAIKGDSAGGNMALVVAVNVSRDSSLPRLQMMSLDYPALQVFNFCLPSFQQYEYGPGFLTKPMMIKYWLTYAFGHRRYYDMYYANTHVSDDVIASELGEYVAPDGLPDDYFKFKQNGKCGERPTDGSNLVIPDEVTNVITNPMYAPLMTSDEDLANLPFSYIVNAEYDALRDEGFILAKRLESIGVEVTHKLWDTEEHGFINFMEIDPIAKQEVDEFSELFNIRVKNKK